MQTSKKKKDERSEDEDSEDDEGEEEDGDDELEEIMERAIGEAGNEDMESVAEEDGRGEAQSETVEMPSPDKTICVEGDHMLVNLNSNDNPDYLHEGARLHGATCSICKLVLSLVEGEKKTLFDAKHPVHCCANQQRRDCKYLLCFSCYTAQLNANSGRPRRTSRPNTPAA